MSDILEPFEADIKWLLERMPDASEAYQDDFAELVATHTASGLADDRARGLALARLEQRRWGSG